mgnify:FL=1|tara:strand:- start:178 stop:477 length:300 start_codon:yes stop_codon:yes gene_type:complete
MKKIKLSVAALLIAGASYGQTKPDSLMVSRSDLREILGDLGDILEWQSSDIEEANEMGEDAKCGKHDEGWGSNHWLTLMSLKIEEIYFGNLKENYNEEN